MIDWLFERWYRMVLALLLVTAAIAAPLVWLEDRAERESAGGQYHCVQTGTVPMWVGKVIVFQPTYSCQCSHER